jgi:hypothetical protein
METKLAQVPTSHVMRHVCAFSISLSCYLRRNDKKETRYLGWFHPLLVFMFSTYTLKLYFIIYCESLRSILEFMVK